MKKVFLFFALIFLSVPWAHAQQDKFKALFVYNFIKSINWPSNYQEGDFVIAVVGKDATYDELKAFAVNKMINSQPLQVVLLNNLSDVPKAHIIYVSPSKSGSLASVVDYYKNQPTLVVCNKDKGCGEGAGINFLLVDNKLKFEICPRNITSRKLGVSPKLTALGIMIE